MRQSKFVKIYKVEDDYAYYHSLRMKPVYLRKSEHEKLQGMLEGSTECELSKELIDSLWKYKIIVNNEDEDEKLLKAVKKFLPKPYISLAYFVLSEQCNLACKYCFLGNGKVNVNSKVTNYPMSKEIADKAIKFFITQIQMNKDYFDNDKEIIFYGGEPLINFETLKYVIERCKKYQIKGVLTQNLKFSMVTNGLLLDESKIDFLMKNDVNVSISIDGVDEYANYGRINKNGKNVFSQLIGTLDLVKNKKMPIGLSITLTEHTLRDVNAIFKLLEKYSINQISFNILYDTEEFKVNNDYYNNATDFIIEFYKKAREMGIYEDRIMRKLKAFTDSELYLSDCAATSGSQIVITPDGAVGVCHGCMENRDYFITDVHQINVNLSIDKVFNEWSQLSPINNQECISCEALGICGGGCPINAMKTAKVKSIHLVDRKFCIHSKKILEFMINDLYRILISENSMI
ncbi:FibroRumin system radical SAM peptide maturase [Clostridium sp. WILCCON 0269]|uniref:FibroRumin system radical SAM peptide maturase n=1 Tax=Candidatus Clostridium eludens TaxID=3381663 RepID=A0ABW8SEI6_9CLOT